MINNQEYAMIINVKRTEFKLNCVFHRIFMLFDDFANRIFVILNYDKIAEAVER